MKKIFISGLAFLMACALFISCQKSGVEPAIKPTLLSSAKNKEAVARAIQNYLDRNGTAASENSNGAKFVAPFFSTEGAGVASFDPATSQLTFVSFEAEIAEGDFYRKNPDGTYSVQVSSNSAFASYSVISFLDFSTVESLYGTPARFTATYTGKLVEFPIYDENGNLLFVFRFIDTDGSSRAVSIEGNGDVGPDGAAPWKKLAMKVVFSPGGKMLVDYSLK